MSGLSTQAHMSFTLPPFAMGALGSWYSQGSRGKKGAGSGSATLQVEKSFT
jgi:hypothetical protein